MVNKKRQWSAIIIVGVLTICSISRELRSPKQQVSTQVPMVASQSRSATIVRPSPTTRPLPTPRQPITGPSAEELRAKWDELTDLQRSTYRREILGSYVRWDVEVVEVHPTGTVNALVMAGTKVLVIVFDVPLSEARKLNREQQITIEGTLCNITLPETGGNLLEELAKSLSLVATLKDVVVLPLES